VVEAVKATAVAHPIQGLIKYHGLADPLLRLPYHDSISVCTAPLTTRTTIEFGDFPRDTAMIGGEPVGPHDLERILSVVDPVRARAKVPSRFRMESVNDFPSNVGLGASASGFAALALAACTAAGLNLDPQEVSRIARRGAGSAARAVTGGFSKWKMGVVDEDSYAVQLAGEDLQMAIVIALVPAFKQTEDAHREAPTSPFFHARLAEMPRLIAEMELAIRTRQIGQVCALAERDTLMLHGITMTGSTEMVLWRPDTLRVILAVKRMREEGIPAFFSIDTGATVYVNTFPDRGDEVEGRIRELGVETIRCRVGGAAHVIGEHLF
jgi:phosphomevalonate decarboxylase